MVGVPLSSPRCPSPLHRQPWSESALVPPIEFSFRNTPIFRSIHYCFTCFDILYNSSCICLPASCFFQLDILFGMHSRWCLSFSFICFPECSWVCCKMAYPSPRDRHLYCFLVFDTIKVLEGADWRQSSWAYTLKYLEGMSWQAFSVKNW